MNLNFHNSPESPSQRMLNAMEPGTVLPIHRHRHTAEMYILLRGRIRVDLYSPDRTVVQSALLDPLSDLYGVEIPCGAWHSLEVLAHGTVIFEVKDGPFRPLTSQDML
jgi:cupin fold WbuC family metalloprotein